MKTINLYKSATAVLLGLTTFAITSCNEDDGNGGTPASVYDVIGEYSDAVMAVNGNNDTVDIAVDNQKISIEDFPLNEIVESIVSEEEADKLKRQYGLAMKSYIDNDNDITLTTCKSEQGMVNIKSSELIEIIEARIEEIFSLVNKDITTQGVKQRINNVVLTGQGITNISKSDVAGKVILNTPVKISTGRLISTIRPEYRTAYSLIRYVAARPFARTVSSSIDTNTEENVFKRFLEKVKDFFYS